MPTSDQRKNNGLAAALLQNITFCPEASSRGASCVVVVFFFFPARLMSTWRLEKGEVALRTFPGRVIASSFLPLKKQPSEVFQTPL